MKLIYAIVNDEDTNRVANALLKEGFYATKLPSTGSFLKAGNTTFLIATTEDKVDMAIDVIKSKAKKRKKFVPSTIEKGVEFPVEVNVGGATIMVTDIERFEKV
ncbi:MAG: cyclic-di-AMP receptor [Ruminococcus sp.]|nr:cyclic-di-AMP receptor [Ruminococcus sp.]